MPGPKKRRDRRAQDEADKKAEAEKREAGEAYAAKSKALRRGGKRTLLSDRRLNPEMGLDEDEYKKTLG